MTYLPKGVSLIVSLGRYGKPHGRHAAPDPPHLARKHCGTLKPAGDYAADRCGRGAEALCVDRPQLWGENAAMELLHRCVGELVAPTVRRIS
jgi:hypothetical protein